MHQQALIYGFGPYAQYNRNITIDVIQQIDRLKLASTVIFETRFSRKMFEKTLKKHQPQIVIGLGQDARARKIRIERRAVNWRKSRTGRGRPISRIGSKYLYVPLKIVPVHGTTVAYDAGDYVCNFSMYIMCEYCQNTAVKFAFLHLPLKVDADLAAALIGQIIDSSQC